MEMNGARIIIECLHEQGVDTVFGYPGGAVLPLYDALFRYGKMKHILTTHEQGASHAADGYARSTGKVGVCIATSGPGATNLVTGLATAYMDSSPVVALTGNVAVPLLGRDSFQEVDITGITMPITKHNFIVKDVKELAHTVRLAFRIAREGRPGPVLVDIPKDVETSLCDYVPLQPLEPRKNRYPSPQAFQIAADMLGQSERPMFYVGGGVIRSGASRILQDFLEQVDAPAAVSLMGGGAIPVDSPRCTGMLGMHGTKVSNMSITDCDLLVVIGARFSDRVISDADRFAPQARILHIDIDPAEIDKNIGTHCHLVGDVGQVLEGLSKTIGKKLKHKAWMEEIARRKAKYPIRVSHESRRPKQIIDAISTQLPRGSFVCTEVGQHQMWASQFLKHVEPGHFITSGGLGTMGFGTGAAIGTQCGNPTARVVSIAGDGSFKMSCNELATIARYKLPIVIFLMNNHTLGMVRQWQSFFFEKRYSETTLDTKIDWVMLAKAFGVHGMRLSVNDDPEKVVKEALEHGGAVVVDCEIPIDDLVYPMVAPGAGIDNMLGVDEVTD
ncbi:biosynthetic-type acetolactate synthase large subunit [Parasphaerochaeta coccoides]|uniref:Acetolactate synthase n=1 Tax=Parasphaerochaeta coccoides (strain ATCC BAA-1237 / DSM 17374 / SPN1) TaxID=760011 RepID=F4GH83_PARC1|nr:biosynthetic-type acetolactate synthase large subunit [Parasphaerochaeta coccoides]AEC01558.1 acetolactate synthase, large subunit, biosynthetic type [Parasphaerochaeta coccoides DSM 17374]